ncbi:hypothetical protein CJU89_2046 [Yarrowia sp. B02]|nr:hypothetical protein CJU89_2046 [Yarrowia sp. B02]
MDSSPIRLMTASEQNAGCEKPVVADKPACTISTPEPSPKRRKISAEEKEKMRLEKEQIKKQKEEEKELLKKQKEEEKEQLRKQKEEEKEQLRKQKEEEKRAKEEEKRRREEEKKKAAEEKELERAKVAEEKAKLAEEKEAKRLEKEAELKKKEQEQTRIMSFFNKKTKKKAKKETADTNQILDFDKDFLPFHIKDTVCMADKDECDMMDQDPVDWLNSLNLSGDNDTVAEEQAPVPAKTIITHIQTAATLGLNPDVYNGTPSDTLVNALPRRYLQFYGDERPAYLGTYSKSCSRDLFQNPLFQVPGLDYEYDSEADWEDEGEDIEDDEMSGDEEMDDDEMADFVCSDDSKSPTSMASKVTTAQEPVVVWGCSDMVGMTFGGLIVQGGIDPFKDYWTVAKVDVRPNVKPETSTAVPAPAPASSSPSASAAPELNPFAVLSKTISSSQAVAQVTNQFLASSKAASKPQKLIAGEDLSALLKRVDGSDDNKTLLTELLCKQYPQYTRKMVTATLQHYAERQGSKNDKRWVLKNV